MGSESQLAFIYICVYAYLHADVRYAFGLGGQAMCSKRRLRPLYGCRLRTPGAERGRNLNKSTALFYQVRLTTAPRLVAFV